MTSDLPAGGSPLRVAFVPGVTPDKWARIWAERMPRAPLELLQVEEEQQTAAEASTDDRLSRIDAPDIGSGTEPAHGTSVT